MNPGTRYQIEKLHKLIGMKLLSYTAMPTGFPGEPLVIGLVFGKSKTARERVVVWCLQDEEGNGPGWLEVEGGSS